MAVDVWARKWYKPQRLATHTPPDLPSYGASSPPFHKYQIILPDERGTCARGKCLEPHCGWDANSGSLLIASPPLS